ncbi:MULTISPECIES: glycoside hydrolase family 88 protein [unclassified Shinella]|uniref:beta-galactosidase BglB n=1 Tax=unclassified Shinella TaxID=2643062 RepID=UPI00225D01D9|nr:MULTISPECIES: glycoside hydrolase family 88 protein [unclassified Shinella]MCO5141146.1 glycoside hydrolase family 88 protein [Shinella sp.]MDC7260005.1 glycoside hydrolase family 88 protein [Shinella sp. YE25]CAI0341543.1 Glycosyl hydrolase family 88 [Rhizobiaceae bacterium]CAK7261168.1 unsaturated rhamnogalacturonyl hydrolase [Shinella sp. WSC3-e]
MGLTGHDISTGLDRLVAGMTGLRHSGRFHEPNLDGTAGDYISFDSWEWPQGVGLYGLVRLWLLTGREDLRTLVEDWYSTQIAAGLPGLNVNTTAPMLGLSLLWAKTRDPRWQPVLDAWANRVLSDMGRTPEGGFEHHVSDKINDHELWDDTLYMVALFLASYGQASGRRELVDEASRQFLVHARYLADPQTGLWFHGWTFDGRHNFARARWARGNAWITAGVLDLFDLAELDRPVRQFLEGVLVAQVDALLALQTPSGAWRTLLDDASSYEEISATAGIGYGLLKGYRLGLGTPAWRAAGMKALEAVMRNIDESGTVLNVSYGTRMGHDLQFYKDIPIQPTGYGQALAILCLAEALEHVDREGQAA